MNIHMWMNICLANLQELRKKLEEVAIMRLYYMNLLYKVSWLLIY